MTFVNENIAENVCTFFAFSPQTISLKMYVHETFCLHSIVSFFSIQASSISLLSALRRRPSVFQGQAFTTFCFPAKKDPPPLRRSVHRRKVIFPTPKPSASSKSSFFVAVQLKAFCAFATNRFGHEWNKVDLESTIRFKWIRIFYNWLKKHFCTLTQRYLMWKQTRHDLLVNKSEAEQINPDKKSVTN